MKGARKLSRILLLSAVLAMLMAGAALAENLTSRSYRLTSKGYIAWSDFQVPETETVTVNLATKTVSGDSLTKKTLNSLRYEIVNLANGKVLYAYTRYGANRYVQVKSSKSQVYDRINVALPAGSYRFRITNTAAASQPVNISYAVTDTRVSTKEYLVTSPVTVAAGQTLTIPTKNNKGEAVKVSAVSISKGKLAKVSISGTNLVVTGKKKGTADLVIRYLNNDYTVRLTVTAARPEFQAYIRNISANRKYMYVRVRNMGTKKINFYSAGVYLYTAGTADNNQAYSLRLARLKFAKGTVYSLKPGKWVTIALKKRSGLFSDYLIAGTEVRMLFRYNSVNYWSAIEDSWLDSQYIVRKTGKTWLPAYSARNNFTNKADAAA